VDVLSETAMMYLVSTIPILLYLLVVKSMDAFSFTSWRRLSVCFLTGVSNCIVIFLFASETQWEIPWAIPLGEELLKALIFILLTSDNKLTVCLFRICFFAGATDKPCGASILALT